MRTAPHTAVCFGSAVLLLLGALVLGKPAPRRDVATVGPTPATAVSATQGSEGAASALHPAVIGPCPKLHSPVLRQGLDEEQCPTWWHQDGSITRRVMQKLKAANGQLVAMPTYVTEPPMAESAAMR